MTYVTFVLNLSKDGIGAARQWVSRFVEWYNEVHLHSGIGFVTPAQKHRGEDHDIMEKRRSVYEQAKSNNPARWSGDIRDWSPVESVWLNPPKEITQQVRIIPTVNRKFYEA